MTHRVTLSPAGSDFSVADGETVLEAALREGHALPYGCRNGACGACKGKVTEGRVDYGDYQPQALSDLEKAAGMALFCTARPLSDLTVEAREVRGVAEIPLKTLPCRVQHMERLANDVMALHLKLPTGERLQFLAGQYVEILLKDGRKRAFSLANPPHRDELLELHVRHVPGGAFTDWVFNELQEKDLLRFEGPHGSFCLDEASDRPIVFVASGTGFAPVKAILEHAFSEGVQRPMVLYWGACTRKDIYRFELAEQWAREHANFRFVPVLSAPAPEDDWSGRTGYVHQAVLDDFADLSAHQVYACGAPVMVEAAHASFTAERGLPDEQFFSDAFTFARDKASKPRS